MMEQNNTLKWWCCV